MTTNNSVIYDSLPKEEKQKIISEDKRMERECRGCFYRRGPHQFRHCDYMGITGHMRPCPPGKDCTVRVQLKTVRRRNK